MPSFCVIDSCKRVKQIGDDVSFHKFPFNNEGLLKKWIDFVIEVDSPREKNLRRQKKITKFSTICCNHFAPDDFTINSLRRRCLKKTAIPSIISKNHNQTVLLPVDIEIENENLTNFCSLCKFPSSKLDIIDDNCFGLIKKCLPLITIHDSLDNICFNCVSILTTFSSFIDKVISTQGNSMTINLPEENSNEFVRNIKTEPITNSDEYQDQEQQKMPFIQIVDFSQEKFMSTSQMMPQKKCEILEIVDIKPFNFEGQHLVHQMPQETYDDDEDIQIIPIERLKVELPDPDDDEEVEEVKNFLPLITLNDHNYHKNEVKTEMNESLDEEIVEVLKHCRHCDRMFKGVKKYLIHKLTHHQHVKIKRKKDVKKDHDKLRRLCRKAIEKRKIQKVMKVFCKSNKKSFKCETCGKIFKGSKNLYQHRLTHSTVNKYACTLCDKTFKRAHGLRQHIKSIHEKEKSHKCPVCHHQYLLKADMIKCRHSKLKKKKKSKNKFASNTS